jgi:hypothetical protein
MKSSRLVARPSSKEEARKPRPRINVTRNLASLKEGREGHYESGNGIVDDVFSGGGANDPSGSQTPVRR